MHAAHQKTDLLALDIRDNNRGFFPFFLRQRRIADRGSHIDHRNGGTPEGGRADDGVMAVGQFGQPHERQDFPDLQGSDPEQTLAGKPEQQKFLGLLRFAGHTTGSFQTQKPLTQELFKNWIQQAVWRALPSP